MLRQRGAMARRILASPALRGVNPIMHVAVALLSELAGTAGSPAATCAQQLGLFGRFQLCAFVCLCFSNSNCFPRLRTAGDVAEEQLFQMYHLTF